MYFAYYSIASFHIKLYKFCFQFIRRKSAALRNFTKLMAILQGAGRSSESNRRSFDFLGFCVWRLWINSDMLRSCLSFSRLAWSQNTNWKVEWCSAPFVKTWVPRPFSQPLFGVLSPVEPEDEMEWKSMQSMRSMILCWSSLIMFHHCLQCFEEILTSRIGLEQNRSSKQSPWAKCTVPVRIGEARSCVRLASSRDEMPGQIIFCGCGWSIHLAAILLVRILPK